MFSQLAAKHDFMLKMIDGSNDTFVRRLIEVSKKAHESANFQPIHIGYLRSDYMIDMKSKQLKMVEYNTVASSMGCLWNAVKGIQAYLHAKYESEMPYDLVEATLSGPYARVFELKFDYKKELAKNFGEAMTHYIPQSGGKEKSKVWFLFVVEDEERNIGDQKFLETSLYFD